MKEKILALLLAVTALTVSGCGMDIGVIGGEDGPTEVIVSGPGVSETVQLPEEEPAGTEPAAEEEPEEPVLLDEDGTYNSAEDVSLYLYTYDHLPDNYITKDEARELGWTGGSSFPRPAGGSITSATLTPSVKTAAGPSGLSGPTTGSSTTPRTTMRALRCCTGRSRMELVIDGAALPAAEAVHDLFARALTLPAWYGRNLDALYDVLTERGEPLRLLVRNREALAAGLGEYAEDLLRTLADAAAENPALTLVSE